MITLTNLQWAKTGISRDLEHMDEILIARRIEKFLLKEFSIICEVKI